MGARPVAIMNLSVAMRLGRVSNLPTVWSNSLAGIALSGGSNWDPGILALILALSLFYIGGMFLNDAFDWKIDSVERPNRPIPSKEVNAKTIYLLGGFLLTGGLLILGGIGYLTPAGPSIWLVASGLVLGGLIVLYNWHHKKNPLSPLIMGACRFMVYITAALAVSNHLSLKVFWGGLVLLSWLIGLTYIAKQENLNHVRNLWPLAFLALPFVYCFPYALENDLTAVVWFGLLGIVIAVLYLIQRRQPGDVGRGVVMLIAGISLLDALFILKWGDHGWGLLAIGAFLLTMVLQRVVPGT